jgi:secondary thiamine-phosphate synthase enzyme
MKTATFEVETKGSRQIQLITAAVQRELDRLGVTDAICTLFTPHTTAALTINENADPDVLRDLERAFAAMVPDVRFDHAEGNSGAHLLSSIVGVSLQLPVVSGKLALGRWQGIYFIEFDGPRRRKVQLYVT